jgi:aryl-alcohol dehydrogenase-like predicted oxidoreductase
MNYRPLGITGITVSDMGFGAWGIGGWREGQMSYGHVSEKQALEALRIALDNGVTFFDTSPLYGLGRSELLIGLATRKCRDRVVIASKVGLNDHNAPADFSPDSMTRSLEESLKRLNTDYLDLLQLHDSEIERLRHSPDIVETLESFKSEGKIRAYGISARSPQDGVIAIRDFEFATVQANFSMLDQRAIEAGLFETASKAGTGIIVRTPLCLGFLTGELNESVCFPTEDHRSRWGREQIIRWVHGARAVLDAARSAGEIGSDTELALRYCLSFPGVSSVIPGPLDGIQAGINAKAGLAGALSNEACQRIRRAYLETDLAKKPK